MAHQILHILGTAQPEGTGIARMVAVLARGLDSERYRIHAWFLGGDGPLVDELAASGVPARAIEWLRGAQDPAGAWRFWRSLRGQSFQIVHVHFGGRSVQWLARGVTGAKIVWHLHGRVRESEWSKLVSYPSSGADVVVAASRAVAAQVEGTQPFVVYSGVQVPQQPDVSVPSVAPKIIGTAGRLVRLKGIEYLLRAVAALQPEFPDLVLEVAGSGPEQEALTRQAQALGLSGRVRFLGWVKELGPVLARWGVFVLPSLEEAFPMAALEAMAAGLPVVASAVGGIPELVEDGRTGYLVPPGDPAALADCLRVLLLDPEQQRVLGAAGQAHVREHFSAERMVARFAEIYDGLVERGEAAQSRR
jgi:glycosyltransferase involved in cell wall biosynthesis